MTLLCPLCPLTSSSASPSTTLSLQSSASAEGPRWSWGSSATSVPSPAAWRGRVPDGAQIQEGPGAEAKDPAAGAFSAAAPGRPLPHRGLPRGDIWGKTNTNLSRGWPFHTSNLGVQMFNEKNSLDTRKLDALTYNVWCALKHKGKHLVGCWRTCERSVHMNECKTWNLLWISKTCIENMFLKFIIWLSKHHNMQSLKQ